ncbi:SIS domain-containing protein, partial [Pseudothermotoga sp.]|uniref:D-sedoheptulose-7-phosphate isomerase n=1 Tax=Pseudothermotoga sp. TaxID=2033661 RepID=UPI0031F6A619
ADAQHLAAELVGKFYLERPSLPAISLTTNTSILTAVANDYTYDMVFTRQIEAIGKAGDVLVGISTSGNSRNVIEAMTLARNLHIKVIALTGESGGKMKDYADILINVPSTDTPRIQELHITVGHIICEIVEREFFGEVKS